MIGQQNNNDISTGHGAAPIIRKTRTGEVPLQYIAPGYGPDDTVVKTILTDANQANDVTRLYAKLDRYNVNLGINHLIFWLNAQRAIGGKNLIYMLMAHSQIVAPEALQVPLSKRGMESVKRAQEDRDKRMRELDQHPA
jgi:hypothetical protein